MQAKENTFRVLPAVLIAAALLASYSNSWSTAFVFDDHASLVHNPLVVNGALLQALIEPNAKSHQGATLSTRPVASFSFALNSWISGASPAIFRAGNILIHWISAWLLWSILNFSLRRAGSPTQPRDAYLLATVIALIWAVHPLHTSVVTYTIQRVEALAGLFYFATWLCFIRAAEARECSKRSGNGWAAASIACCLLGMASKEVMVSAPLIVLLYDRVVISQSFKAAWQRHGAWHVGLFACWILLGVVVFRFSLGNETIGEYVGATWGSYFLSQGYFISRYLFLVVWPATLVFDYGFTPVSDLPRLLGGFGLIATLAVLTLLAWRSHFKLALAGTLFFALLAPSSSVILIGTEIAAEHRMYMASMISIGFVVLAVHRWLAGDHQLFNSA
jgi:hypothetical protein